MALLQRANTLRIAMQRKADAMIDAHRQAAPRWTKTSLRMGAMLLCVYAAMHLAAAGIIRLITGHDAAALVAPVAAPDAPAAVAGGTPSRERSTSAFEAGGLQGEIAVSVGRVHACTCKPDRPIDSRCL
ncbi:MAG TPA: hypothetical protein VL742_19595 [Casimicrobiaceae bacterium]|nr:hypothetical protein [Casimicrobiaceae bacterium]